MAHILPYLSFGTHHTFGLLRGFAYVTPTLLAPVFPFPAYAFHTCPHSSVILQYRNFNLLSIDYAFRPRLRSRLTQSGRTFLWKPWVFGAWDSHPRSATHTGILSSCRSTCPCGHASSLTGTLPYHLYLSYKSIASVLCLAPVNFRRRVIRPVSCYALFKGWLLLSQPPGCLDISTSFST